MILHLHFTLKISADFFGSFEIKRLAQWSFENLKEFGLRARILKHFMEVEKITFCLKRYLSNHPYIFGIIKHTSCLSSKDFRQEDCAQIGVETLW
jgi:hypothetical protein